MLIRQAHLALRQHHAAAFHAPDFADAQLNARARNLGPWRCENAEQAGARVGRTAHHLLGRAAIAAGDGEHLKPVRVGVGINWTA